ncbi:MAG: methyltransferase domain-containing protein [Anaerolineae bacterium]|nr:methyltransferase domain-containing protein [Anaerolineae bacterium]
MHNVDAETVSRLQALNQQFYNSFAQTFAESRPVSDPALVCILPYIPESARLLDAGCGNGRLAQLLDRDRPGTTYLGIDSSADLITIARATAEKLTNVSASFLIADITQPEWPTALAGGPFDCCVSLAVLHHIPSIELRTAAVRAMAGAVRQGGTVILSAWQFMNSARLRRKIVPWAEAGLTPDSLDVGDYLLDWKRDGRGLRYCHLIDEGEIAAHARASHLQLQHTFLSGGREGNLGLFAILSRD